MAKRKVRTVKITLMNKGEVITYQALSEYTMGPMLASLSMYNDDDIEGAILTADCDYEIIIRPKK